MYCANLLVHLQAAFFTGASITAQDSYKYMGILSLLMTASAWTLWFPMWGGMALPAKACATEQASGVHMRRLVADAGHTLECARLRQDVLPGHPCAMRKFAAVSRRDVVSRELRPFCQLKISWGSTGLVLQRLDGRRKGREGAPDRREIREASILPCQLCDVLTC